MGDVVEVDMENDVDDVDEDVIENDSLLVDSAVVGSGENIVVKTFGLELWDELELKVVDTVTPGFEVGIVTLSEVVFALAVEVLIKVLVVVEGLMLGHNATIIPPPLTIPNNVFAATLSAEQALLTLEALEVKAD